MAHQARPATAPLTVLVADDSIAMRDALTALIEDEPDMRVVAATCADEAVDIAAAQHPDVAVLDVHMPGCGTVAAARISRSAPDTKLIVLTGDARALSDHDRERLHLSAYLVKGVANATIIAAIRRAAGPGFVADAWREWST